MLVDVSVAPIDRCLAIDAYEIVNARSEGAVTHKSVRGRSMGRKKVATVNGCGQRMHPHETIRPPTSSSPPDHPHPPHRSTSSRTIRWPCTDLVDGQAIDSRVVSSTEAPDVSVPSPTRVRAKRIEAIRDKDTRVRTLGVRGWRVSTDVRIAIPDVARGSPSTP